MRTLVIAACLLACTSCIPVSLHSIAQGEHRIFDPKYIGVWGDVEGGAWELRGGQVNGSHPDPDGGGEYVMEYDNYDVYYTESGKTSALVGELTTIDGVQFLDLSPQHGINSRWGNNEPGGGFLEELLSLPLHTWVKISVVDDKLRLQPVDLDYIHAVLEKDPSALPHLYPDNGDWSIVTASSDQLRAFIATHMHNEGFFGELGDLPKLSMPQPRTRSRVQTGANNYDSQYRSQPTATQQTYEQAEKNSGSPGATAILLSFFGLA